MDVLRHFALLTGFLLLLSALHADVSTSYTQDGLFIERSMQIRPIDSISSITGALRALNGSVITLAVTNRGPSDRRNLTLEEDLTYLPSYIRITYSIRPTQTDGRKAVWNVGDLPAGRRFEVSFSLPTPVSDASVAAAKPPVVRSARPPAEIIAPNLVDKGQTVVLRLTTPSGTPIGGAQLQVIQPDGTRASGTTDELGRLVFVADQTGFYTYGIPDFSAGAIPATESRVPVVVTPPTTGSITPVANTSNSASSFFSLDSLFGLWPIAGGLLIVGLVAFGVYGYFNRPASDDGPTVPAPAYRSAPPGEAGGPSTMPSSKSSDGQGSSSAMDRSAASTSASLGTAGSPAISSSPTAVLSQTRDLLAARREAKARPDVSSEKSMEAERGDFSSKPHYTEETTVASERSSEEQSGAQEEEEDEMTAKTSASDSDGSESSGETESSEVSSHSKSAGSPPPSWMTQEALSGERSEVDDEAISKTISELEALRSELKSRAKARAAGEEAPGASQGRQRPSRERHLEETFAELDKLGKDMDEEGGKEAADDPKEAQDDVLSGAGEPEASDEEITESIAPADAPTVSEAAGAGETTGGEETGAGPEQEEASDAPDNPAEEISRDGPSRGEPSDSDGAESSSPPPAPAPRFQIRDSISIAPIPPRMRRPSPTRKEIVKRLEARSKISSSALRKSVPLSKQASAPPKRGLGRPKNEAPAAPPKRGAAKTKKR